jgi:hypothetical protein
MDCDLDRRGWRLEVPWSKPRQEWLITTMDCDLDRRGWRLEVQWSKPSQEWLITTALFSLGGRAPGEQQRPRCLVVLRHLQWDFTRKEQYSDLSCGLSLSPRRIHHLTASSFSTISPPPPPTPRSSCAKPLRTLAIRRRRLTIGGRPHVLTKCTAGVEFLAAASLLRLQVKRARCGAPLKLDAWTFSGNRHGIRAHSFDRLPFVFRPLIGSSTTSFWRVWSDVHVTPKTCAESS